ncbi:MAG: MaoC family dehydratase [Phyllobacteriaceae bacterium]|nr:MaoC family dehydratase [Phyllobacteriaceae bacterium]
MQTKRWAWEDMPPGSVIPLASRAVTAEEIIEFAAEFDPQPFHLDEAAGKASILGGLAASGWHTCSMLMRMMCDAFLLDSTSQGAPGVDHVNWRKPVLAGDTLNGAVTVLDRRRSKSRPEIGLVTCVAEMRNQRGETVIDLKNTGMFLLRNPEAA